MFKIVYSIFIHNCEKLETTQVSINRRMYKQMLCIHTWDATQYFKKRTIDRHNSMDETQKHYVEQKQTHKRVHII